MVLHIATNGHYGFHRDELQTLDDARHLDWGFVAYPPITPLIGRLELILFGTSLIGFRVFSATAVSIIMVLAGSIANELGGNRQVQVLAAVAAGISPVSLVQGAVFQYASFDYLWGVTISPKFQRVTQSILLIPKGIAKNSACGYWEHPQQFVSPGLHGRRIRHLLESRFRRLLGLVRFERISHSRPAGQLLE